MKFKVNNEEVFASTGGRPIDKNKPLIIFVHGSGLTHMCWVLQTRYFAFHGYSVLALDLPGHGLSGGKSLKSIEEMAEWIKNVIDAVGFKEASLVAHSQGCLIAIECTFRYPKKIKTLCLMGGAGAIPMNPKLLSLAENNDSKAVDLMMDWAHGPSGHFGGHPVPGLYHLNTGSMLVHSKEIKDTLGIDFRACDNYKNGFEAAKKLSLPTLNILADQDKMCPLKEGKKLAGYINGCELTIIDNCGHMMLLEEADKTLKELKKFITINFPSK
jgi:pimeloyl-ACP methyl ester carboxylesterase